METNQTNFSSKLESILVPVDYSDCSILAVRFAARMAMQTKAQINLFHAFYSPAYDLIELSGDLRTQEFLRKDITKKLMVTETEQMEQLLQLLMQYDEIRTLEKNQLSYKLCPGLPKDCIMNQASRTNPNLVIMGTRGQEKKAQSILGSTTEIAIRKLPYPVLAVPEEFQFDFSHSTERANMIYLTDFDESDFLSIKNLMSLLDVLKLNIHCLHLTDKIDRTEEKKLEGLRSYFESAYGHHPFICKSIVKGNDYIEVIDNYSQHNNIRLIALTTKKRKLYEKVFKPNITKKLFYHTTIPLLVFHS